MNDAEIQNHLARISVPAAAQTEILTMIKNSPARDVGRSAKDNVVVRLYSHKNNAIRVLESHTVERTCALELELDPNVLAYYCQVRCEGVERYGGKHVSAATVDFISIEKDRIRLVECKSRSAVIQLANSKPDEWRLLGDKISRPPLENWAAARSLAYDVWIEPVRVAPYLANLQLVYAATSSIQIQDNTTAAKAIALIKTSPCTIQELMERIPRFTPAIAACLLGRRVVHGPWRNCLISDIDRFPLFSDSYQAEAFDEELSRNAKHSIEQSNDPISRASNTDIEKGRARLKKVHAYLESGRIPKYWKPLAKAVLNARDCGWNELEACLTKYKNSGNRDTRLSDQQRRAIESVCKKSWDSGKSASFVDLHLELAAICEADGIRTPSRKTLIRWVGKRPRDIRILATQGMRGYHANRPASDPRSRSMPALCRHLVLEIDSTKCDNRFLPDATDPRILETAILYSGIDGSTFEPMAMAFVFGPSRRDGLSLLLRDYLRRHGCLPHEIRIDRGPENTSVWLEDFCDQHHISLVIMPTGGSRFKGGVENLLGRVNSQISHKLVGSTRPDQAGRAVDGKFKSYRTARLHFSTIRTEIEKALFHDYTFVPDGDGFTPADRRLVSLEEFPGVGVHCRFDEDFVYMTSVPVKSLKFDPLKGIRTHGQTFTSEELLAACRHSKIIEARRDPSDPSLLRVQASSGRYRAWSRLTSSIAHKDTLDKEFHYFMSATMRDQAAAEVWDIKRERYRRLTAANAPALPGSPPIAGGSTMPTDPSQESPWTQVDFDSITDLKEE